MHNLGTSFAILITLGAFAGCGSPPVDKAGSSGSGDDGAGETSTGPAGGGVDPTGVELCSDFSSEEQACSPAWRTLPTNGDPTRQIRFDGATGADAKRSELEHYIWANGLPKTTPQVTRGVAFPPKTTGIDPRNVARVDRLEAMTSFWDYRVISFVMHPQNTTNVNRVVIVHQGHAQDLVAGVGTTANHLLANGFTVVAMMMPLYAWDDGILTLPGAWSEDPGVTFKSHNAMFSTPTAFRDGRPFRMFFEPIVQAINHVVATTPGLKDLSMIGLSGGGWATAMMAAIDPRIRLSVPVAGSSPLYHRAEDPKSVGDREQYDSDLYSEAIEPDGSGGGIATWLEIYALGGHGAGRRQIQVSNEFDPCCFSGRFADSYKTIVAEKVASLGEGRWEYFLDSTHKAHQISPSVIEAIIDPALGIVPSPNPVLPGPATGSTSDAIAERAPPAEGRVLR